MASLACSYLIIYYLINGLFVVDSRIVLRHQFNCQSKEFLSELKEARQQRTAKLIDLLYEAVRLFIAKHPECLEVTQKPDGAVRYQARPLYPESKALIYILHYEEDVRNIVLSPEIELSQSCCERAIKGVIYLRNNCQFLKSEDGAAAFADYESIAHTCSLCGVPVYNYSVWLVANIRQRLLALQSSGHSDPTFFRMPQRQVSYELVAADGKQTTKRTVLGIYDPQNRLCYDKVDYAGLTPYDYRKYLDSKNSSEAA